MDNQIQNTPSQMRGPFLLFLGVAAGLVAGSFLFNAKTHPKSNSQLSKKVEDILTLVEKEYVDSVSIDSLVDMAISGLLSQLDPHSSYIPPAETEFSDMQLESAFEGIGIKFFIRHDTLVCLMPIKGGPSANAGMQAGDEIIDVDGEPFSGTGIDSKKIFAKLRGPAGSAVALNILRNNKSLTLNVTRSQIPNPSVDAAIMLNPTIGYIKITRFTAETANEARNAIQRLKGNGMQKLLLDLRNNSGGYLSSAVALADEFLEGNKLIVYTKSKNRKNYEEYLAKEKGVYEKEELVTLINESTASAAEILAGALQDHDRSIIIGRRSFGKGLVQAPIKISDGSEIRITISRYYTPSGRSIQKPYQNNDDYENDIYQRYHNGEVLHPDSTKQNLNQVYKTASGRTVYGGGGIMPDVFVAADTAPDFRHINPISNSSLLNSIVIAEFKRVVALYQSKDWQSFYQLYNTPNNLLEEIYNQAVAEKIFDKKPDLSQASYDFMSLYVKALLAQLIYGDDVYFAIQLLNDPEYTIAIANFKN